MALTQNQIDTLRAGQIANKELLVAQQHMEAVFLKVQGGVEVNPAIIDYASLKAEFQAEYLAARTALSNAWSAWQTADQAIIDLT